MTKPFISLTLHLFSPFPWTVHSWSLQEGILQKITWASAVLIMRKMSTAVQRACLLPSQIDCKVFDSVLKAVLKAP